VTVKKQRGVHDILVVKEVSLWQASYDMRWAERLIPNFSILCRSVIDPNQPSSFEIRPTHQPIYSRH
jgi:hypothetical protein